MWRFLLPAIFTGTILAMSVVSGEALNPVRYARPLIVTRAETPGKYWVGVVVEVFLFAFAVFWGVAMAFW